VEITCANCGEKVAVNPDRAVVQIDRPAIATEPPTHVILETDIADSRPVHRCVIED
jgi:hypothetical protein